MRCWQRLESATAKESGKLERSRDEMAAESPEDWNSMSVGGDVEGSFVDDALILESLYIGPGSKLRK
jgi:hypothetical protein